MDHSSFPNTSRRDAETPRTLRVTRSFQTSLRLLAIFPCSLLFSLFHAMTPGTHVILPIDKRHEMAYAYLVDPEFIFVPSAFKHGVTKEDIYHADMTDEEYDALDEELTRNPPRIISNGSDWLSLREIRISGLKNMTIQYLLTKAKATSKSPVQIIDEIVQEKITATAM